MKIAIAILLIIITLFITALTSKLLEHSNPTSFAPMIALIVGVLLMKFIWSQRKVMTKNENTLES